MIDLLATVLHRTADAPMIEEDCYCRRISTVDMTLTGEQSPYWGQKPYDPAEWGEDDPPRCEQTAAALIEAAKDAGIHLIKVNSVNPDGR